MTYSHWSVGDRCILSICAFCYMWNLFGVMVFHRSIVNWSMGVDYPQYMCILQHVKLIWCEGIPKVYCYCSGGWIYPHLESRCILSMCVFCYMWNLFGVTVFHRYLVNWSGGTCILSICAFCYMWNLFGVY